MIEAIKNYEKYDSDKYIHCFRCEESVVNEVAQIIKSNHLYEVPV